MLCIMQGWLKASAGRTPLFIQLCRVIPLSSLVSQSGPSIAVFLKLPLLNCYHTSCIRPFHNSTKNVLVWTTKHQPKKGGGQFFRFKYKRRVDMAIILFAKLEQVCNHVTTVERPLLASKTFHIVFACKKLVWKGKQMPRPEIVIYNLI